MICHKLQIVIYFSTQMIYTCLSFQHKDLEPIKEELTKNFSNMCDWFVDDKLSIDFGEDKTKTILHSTKNRKRKLGTLDIQYSGVKIKQ